MYILLLCILKINRSIYKNNPSSSMIYFLTGVCLISTFYRPKWEDVSNGVESSQMQTSTLRRVGWISFLLQPCVGLRILNSREAQHARYHGCALWSWADFTAILIPHLNRLIVQCSWATKRLSGVGTFLRVCGSQNNQKWSRPKAKPTSESLCHTSQD